MGAARESHDPRLEVYDDEASIGGDCAGHGLCGRDGLWREGRAEGHGWRQWLRPSKKTGSGPDIPVYPRAKKIIDRWKQYGYYVIFHSDGKKWPVIQDLIDLGADSINPCEPLATMEVKRFREEYPDTVIGSMVDCQDLLAFGTPEQIKAKTRQAIEDSGGAKTLVGSTSEIHPEIPVENAMAMYEVARDAWF